VFFVISGFVMVWSSRSLFGRPGAVRLFAGRRVARVVPLYWGTTALLLLIGWVLPASVSDGAPTPGLIVASFLFLPWRRSDGLIQPVYRLGWTLDYEMLFYAIFALWVGLRPPRAVAGVIGTVTVLALLGAVLRPESTALAFWTDSIVLEFALGALLAVLAPHVRLPAPLRIAAALAGLLGLGVAEHLTNIPHGIAYGLPCAALMAGAVLGPSPKLWPGAMAAGVRLGDASYALYLMHPFPMRALALVWSRLGHGSVPSVLAYVATAMAAAVALAFVVHCRVERPLTRAVRRWLRA
jgi:peptidoglycan/LPS O-acetylase OafA/YrhL